jgi:hypothetical protein
MMNMTSMAPKHPVDSLRIIAANIIKFSFIIEACKHLAKGRLILCPDTSLFLLMWATRVVLCEVYTKKDIYCILFRLWFCQSIKTSTYSTIRLNMISAHCQQSPVVYCNEKKLYHFRIFEFKSGKLLYSVKMYELYKRNCSRMLFKPQCVSEL